MSWIQNFIKNDPDLAGSKILRHRYWVAGVKNDLVTLKTFGGHPVNFLKGGRWAPIDERLREKGNGYALEHIPFSVLDGVIADKRQDWRPTRWGGFSYGSFRPIGNFGPAMVKDNRILRSSALGLYETVIHGAFVKDNLYMPELPAITESHLAIEFDISYYSATPCDCRAQPAKFFEAPIYQGVNDLAADICDQVVIGNKGYVLIPMESLAGKQFPVIWDPTYDPAGNCWVKRDNVLENYPIAHGGSCSGCSRTLTTGTVGQSRTGSEGSYRYSVLRWAIGFDLSGVTDLALQAYSTWAKQTEFADTSSYSIRLYRTDWGLYDDASSCQVITCPNCDTVKNDYCRDDDGEDEEILDENDPVDTYFDTGNMSVSWINSVTQSGSEDRVYYCLKAKSDEEFSTPSDVEATSVYYGGTEFPAYLTLVFEAAGAHYFGTILGL